MKRLLIAFLLLALPVQAGQVTRFTLPAERMRGVTWADDFRSQTSCEDNGATVTGSPTFSVSDGVTLDGTTDCLQYDLCGHEFDSDPISIVIEFTPDFDYDEDEYSFFYCTDNAGSRYSMSKYPNAWANAINVRFGNTSIDNIAAASYSAYWKVGERNTIVASSTSGDTDVYLNGHLVLDSSATAWTPKEPPVFIVGDYDGLGGNNFDGTIHSVKVFHAKLTADEAEDYYDQTTFAHQNLGTTWTFCNSTLLSDTAGNNTLSVNGTASKDTLCGYTYDGTTGYLQGTINTGIFDNDPLSIVIVFKPDFDYDGATDRMFFDADDGASAHRTYLWHDTTNSEYDLYIHDTEIGSIAEAVVGARWITNQTNIIVMSGESGDTDLYLNGALLMDSDATAWTAQSDVDRLTVGADYTGADFYDGSIQFFQVLPTKLTQLQVHDITARVRRQVQNQ